MIAPEYPSGRYIVPACQWVIKRTTRIAPSYLFAAANRHLLNLCETDTVLDKVPDLNAWYIAHEVDAPIARMALWVREHRWCIRAFLIRIGVMVCAEGDWYVNASWRFPWRKA